jgi:hypothetical protein
MKKGLNELLYYYQVTKLIEGLIKLPLLKLSVFSYISYELNITMEISKELTVSHAYIQTALRGIKPLISF